MLYCNYAEAFSFICKKLLLCSRPSFESPHCQLNYRIICGYVTSLKLKFDIVTLSAFLHFKISCSAYQVAEVVVSVSGDCEVASGFRFFSISIKATWLSALCPQQNRVLSVFHVKSCETFCVCATLHLSSCSPGWLTPLLCASR